MEDENQKKKITNSWWKIRRAAASTSAYRIWRLAYSPPISVAFPSRSSLDESGGRISSVCLSCRVLWRIARSLSSIESTDGGTGIAITIVMVLRCQVYAKDEDYGARWVCQSDGKYKGCTYFQTWIQMSIIEIVVLYCLLLRCDWEFKSAILCLRHGLHYR